MRWSFIAMLTCTTLGCAQLLGLGDFGEGGSTGTSHGGSAGATGDGNGGSAGATGDGGSGGVAQGGGGSGGEAGCGDEYNMVVALDMPISYIRFEETSGTSVLDDDGHSGSVADGVDLNVPGLLECGDGSAVRFPGETAVNVDFGSMLGFPGQSSFSLEVWLRSAKLDGAVIRQLGGYPHNGYSLAYSNDELRFHRYKDSNTDTVAVGSSIIGANGIHHVVATYDGGVPEMCLYVDGIQHVCAPSPKYIGANTGSFLIGTSSFEGDIDEVAVYQSALSLEQVVAHYTAGSGQSP